MVYRIEPKVCHEPRCEESYIPHREGSIDAARAGWLMQRNGDAWCPQHLPDWVAAWRAQKALKGRTVK